MSTTSTRRRIVAIAAVVCAAGTLALAAEDSRLAYARELLHGAGPGKQATLDVDTTLAHGESYRIGADGQGARIAGGGPAGVLYGVQQWLALPSSATMPIFEKPDFELRGTVLFLMKEGSYDYQLTSREFPWFFDRPLLSRYLDYLLANRFNTIYLWTGNLFPSIVEMPEYPDATDLSKADLARNQEQFKWFTRECAKRNISVLLHFYQVHIPIPLAKARNIPAHYTRPNDFVRTFIRYSLGRFLTEFDAVGLYVCPGEQLLAKYQPEWIRDVIFAAAKASGKHPLVVIRDWALDKDLFKKVCKDEYDNYYTELKHNVEMIVSPVPDERYKFWKGVARKHIVNLHELSDVKPFRWASPTFVREMVGEWKRAGVDGAEVYGMTSWRWPYALDKLDDHQTTYWPAGSKLLTIERDAIWLEMIGRYLWKADRDPKAEAAYWTGRLAATFGNRQAGDLLRQWYEVSGPVLPGLQNLTHVRNMNWYPTSVGAEQKVDWILDGVRDGILADQRPVDLYFLERYKNKYSQPTLGNRITMPVAAYAEKLARRESAGDVMTPDRVADLLVALAEESLDLARQSRQAATVNQEEASRFVTDSQALVYIAQAYRHKVLAAIERRMAERTGDAKHRDACLRHLEASIKVYEQLVALTDKTYINATDMVLGLNWHNGLTVFQNDLNLEKARAQPDVYWLEAEDMDGDWKAFTKISGYSGRECRLGDATKAQTSVLRKQVTIDQPGRYTVWVRGLLESHVDHSFAVDAAGKALVATYPKNGPARGEYVWQKAGEVELLEGACEIVIRNGPEGCAAPDAAVVLAKQSVWQPL